MGLSQRIDDSVGHLLPLYVQEEVNGKWCVRSLDDGTLVLPVEENEDEENGWIQVWWQGDSKRATDVIGVFYASLAIATYVDLHHTDTHAKEKRPAMEHLSDHFAVKTGASLTFEMPEDNLLPLVGRAVSKLGESWSSICSRSRLDFEPSPHPSPAPRSTCAARTPPSQRTSATDG